MRKQVYVLLLSLLVVGSVSAQSTKAILRGRIYDFQSNEPLPFATVALEDGKTGTLTDEKGEFEFLNLKPGFVRIQVSTVGYESVFSDDILLSNAQAAYIELGLRLAADTLQAVTVAASPFRRIEESPVSLHSIGLRDIETNPGSNRDISKIIQSFPGVGFTPSFRNDVIVRGGGPSEARFYLDGVEIPTLNHFATQGSSGGAVGIINADFIRSVNYYSGAFPASRSNALSGVFEFNQKDGNSERMRYRMSVGASEMSLTTDGPLGKNTTMVASVRRSYLQFLFDALGLPFLPTFTDFQLKVKSKLSEKSQLSIIGLGAIDQFKLNTGLENPDESQQYILNYLPVNEQWNYALGAVYKHFSENGFQRIVFSRNMLNNTAYKYPDNQTNREKTYDYLSQEMENKFRFEGTYRFSGHKLIAGLDAGHVSYNNETYQQIYLPTGLEEVDYQSDISFFTYGAFGQLSKKTFSERLTVSLGVRFDGNSFSEAMANPLQQLSPRLATDLQINPRWNLSAATGRYFQRPPYTALGYRNSDSQAVNKDRLRYIRSDHFTVGVTMQPNSASQIAVEGFYKLYDDYPFSLRDSIPLANKGADFGVIGDEPLEATAQGRAYGMEVIGRWRNIDQQFNLIVSYTYVRSEFKGPEDDDYIPSAWDSRHLFILTSTKTFDKNWTIGLKWRYAGGLPYTPYDLERSALVEAWDTQGRPYLDYSQLNQERLPAFHQLDLRVDRRFFFDRWSLMLYLDVQNVYNFQAKQVDNYIRENDANGQAVVVNPDASADQQRYQLRGIESATGTVLPTIGIMVEF